MQKKTTIFVGCLTVALGAACVKKSTYEAVLRETDFAKAEIDRAKEEQRLLDGRVRQLEQMNAVAMRDAETTAAMAQQAKDEAEKQRKLTEDQQEKLSQKIAQLTRQQAAFEKAIVIAKENGAALQELVEVYQKKVRDAAGGTSPASVPQDAVQKPFDPAALPPAQELPAPAPVLEPAKPQVGPSPESPPPQSKPTPEPAEASWLGTIKDWIVSLWHSIFS